MTTRKFLFLFFISTVLPTFGQNDNKDGSFSMIVKHVGPTTVTITQRKGSGQTSGQSYCSAEIQVKEKSGAITTINFKDIEPVGGRYGIHVFDSLISNHLIISKYGDYNGRTIIINSDGKIFNTIGGDCFYDKKSGLLFSIYDSDMSGMSVFDVLKDKEIFEIKKLEVRPTKFYKYKTDRYLFTSQDNENKKNTIWEIEFDLERIMEIDISLNDLKDFELRTLENYKTMDIKCE